MIAVRSHEATPCRSSSPVIARYESFFRRSPLGSPPSAEAMGRRHHSAQVTGRLVVRPRAARLDVTHLAKRHVRPLEPPHRAAEHVGRALAALELAVPDQ